MAYRILHTEWSSGWGGQEQRIVLESLRVGTLGHEVTIAAQPGSAILDRAARCGIPTAALRIRGSFDRRAIGALIGLIRERDIQVVNTHSGKDSWVGAFAAKLARADLLVRTRHLFIPMSKNPLNFVHRMPDGIITTGEIIRQMILERQGIAPEKVNSIPTGVSIERFHPGVSGEPVRHELGIAEDAVVIAMVAVIRGMKRHDLLVEAARQLKGRFPAVKYILAGDGPMRVNVERHLAETGLADDFFLLGHREDVPQILAAADIIALTSSKFEGVPQCLGQALAMGKPIVAAPVGGIPELLIDGKTGLMAEVGSAASFAGALERLIGDAALRHHLGRAGRQRILDGFTDTGMAERVIGFYDALLQRKRLRL